MDVSVYLIVLTRQLANVDITNEYLVPIFFLVIDNFYEIYFQNILSNRLLFTFCMVFMLMSLTVLLQDSLSTQSEYITTTSKESQKGTAEDPYFPDYPRITICRKPGYRVRK